MTNTFAMISAGVGPCPRTGRPCLPDWPGSARADLRIRATPGTPAGVAGAGASVTLAACQSCGRVLLLVGPAGEPVPATVREPVGDGWLGITTALVGAELADRPARPWWRGDRSRSDR
ncbi:MAG: hypothetical protein ACJ768_24575 [Gaiellaceae bacterium]|jgi:hypothetical protein